jgi:tetratricopeptide (TPR) repeat protein
VRLGCLWFGGRAHLWLWASGSLQHTVLAATACPPPSLGPTLSPLQPNYMRAWTNMGVAYANVGDYTRSAAFYVRALALNPGADHVWGYLRTSLACAGQQDMLAAADRRDLAALQASLPL